MARIDGATSPQPSSSLRRVGLRDRGEPAHRTIRIAIHWGILSHLRSRIEVRPAIVAIAIALDVIVLAAFLWVKASDDTLVLFVSAAGIALIVAGERLFMWSHTDAEGHMDMDMDMDM